MNTIYSIEDNDSIWELLIYTLEMTGSAIADASGLGKMEIDSMRNEGYDDGFSCAITAASATIGPIFPPSIPIVIYSMLSGASVGALFMGGMVPAVLLAVALMLYVAYFAHKRNYPVSQKIIWSFEKGCELIL